MEPGADKEGQGFLSLWGGVFYFAPKVVGDSNRPSRAPIFHRLLAKRLSTGTEGSWVGIDL